MKQSIAIQTDSFSAVIQPKKISNQTLFVPSQPEGHPLVNFGRFDSNDLVNAFFQARGNTPAPYIIVDSSIAGTTIQETKRVAPSNDSLQIKNSSLSQVIKQAYDFRGYLMLAGASASLIAQGATVACLDLAVLFTIISVSSDGPKLLGHMGRFASKISFLKTPAGKALLMALPVKTITAMLGAMNTTELVGVATHAALGLAGLTVGLTVWYGIEKAFSFSKNKLSNLSKNIGTYVTALDFSLLGFLFVLGKDGEAVLGSTGKFIQDSVPIAQEPWVRGLLAILPIKTTATLLLAKSSDERQKIALNGTRNMFVLTAFASVVALSASASIGFFVSGPIAMATGFVTYLTWEKISGMLTKPKDKTS